MNTSLNRNFQRPLQGALKLACVAAILAGCGGGGGSGTTGTTFASGTITGFGSVILNHKTRFDDSAAKIRSDDDDANEVHDKSELKLGMQVEVEAGDVTDDSSGRHSKASEIRFGSELVGPVDAVNAANSTFTVLGKTVKVDPATTIFDDSISGGFSPALVSIVVEVHGLLDSVSNTYTATRVEAKAGALSFKIRGVIDSINGKTITIGGETISLDSIASLPTLKVGDVVRVKVNTVKVGSSWVAISIKSGARKVEDHDEAEIKGAVKITGTNLFDVDGTHVDASKVASMPVISDGDFVEVEGSIVNGVLIAKKVELEDSSAAGAGEFEFHRKVTAPATATAIGNGTFDLGTAPNVTTISWDNTTTFVAPASSGSLVANTCIEVKAKLVSGALHAVRISLDNTCTQ